MLYVLKFHTNSDNNFKLSFLKCCPRSEVLNILPEARCHKRYLVSGFIYYREISKYVNLEFTEEDIRFIHHLKAEPLREQSSQSGKGVNHINLLNNYITIHMCQHNTFVGERFK